ncbi:MAG: glycine C-acetyltransferase [Candidatus Edwardsbacteria bacterium]|nr:glycine C-acetyltransferase [Candidatus Edwardsbacteria bacterium]MBU1575977.1 glycine C-acetyltransferase [Candidatus Edwardsbacteria bacterium]MBU2595070.1 glycine C-acetyltransferase [Candidatus Edwardsbacteria bacterium]
MHKKVKEFYRNELVELQNADLFKEERYIHTPQAASIKVEYPANSPQKEVINFCANNYLGLSNHPAIVAAAKQGLEERGFGLSSVRFICGTQDKHKELERKISKFLGMEDAILYSSCFDANLGVFEALLGEEDALISDELNHASIIDGIRLCKAERRRFKHMDMHDLEAHLKQTRNSRFRMIVTDGVFSMDGDLAPLEQICNLAESYEAMVLVDESHASGFIGKTGRGTHQHADVMGRVDIITTTFGKALGGASGGCIASSQEIINILRQRSRPYLFSNTISPSVVAATIKAIEMMETSTALRDKVMDNAKYFRQKIKQAGFDIREGIHPIVPIILHEAEAVQKMSRQLYEEGIYVIGFFYPVVPRGRARIRVQISAAHEREHLDKAIAAFTKVGKKLGVLKPN